MILNQVHREVATEWRFEVSWQDGGSNRNFRIEALFSSEATRINRCCSLTSEERKRSVGGGVLAPVFGPDGIDIDQVYALVSTPLRLWPEMDGLCQFA